PACSTTVPIPPVPATPQPRARSSKSPSPCPGGPSAGMSSAGSVIAAVRGTGRSPRFSPSCAEKKQRTWSRTPLPRRFAFSKPVSEGLNREIAFENGYREVRTRRIAWSLPKVLGLLDYRRLRELILNRRQPEDRWIFLRYYRKPKA